MAKSTSFHQLNGDRSLNRLQRGLYFALNRMNNSFPNLGVDSSLKCTRFRVEDLNKYWWRCYSTSSPSRKLSDIYWMNLPWEELQRELDTVIAFDSGCGSGNYGRRLKEWSDNKIGSYTGIDLKGHENWAELKKESPVFEFHDSDSNEIRSFIKPGTNFFMSQSAIEHFDEDLTFFRQIKDHIQSDHKNTVQLHLFPSSACLNNYGLHGYRQYTPRTVSKICRLFKDFSYAILFELGGENCNRLHRDFITYPLSRGQQDYRESRTSEYDRLLRIAIQKDMLSGKSNPVFYALFIHSNWRRKLFEDTV